MHAELSSMSSTISATKARITALAEGLRADRHADLLGVLHEIERSLGSVHRQLDRATRLARSATDL